MQELLTSHRSIRQFKDTPIPDELLNEMLYAGLRGSSSGNMQTWSVIVTRDPEMKEKLFVAHREQEMVRQAPVVLTFCADVFRMREWIRVNNSKQSFDDLLGFLTGAVDAIISAQNITLAAEAAGRMPKQKPTPQSGQPDREWPAQDQTHAFQAKVKGVEADAIRRRQSTPQCGGQFGGLGVVNTEPLQQPQLGQLEMEYPTNERLAP